MLLLSESSLSVIGTCRSHLLLSTIVILDEVHISDILKRMVAVDLDDTFELIVRKLEVDGGQHLSELFGSHFLVSMSVPVLEEGLQVQSGRNAELSESISETIHTLELFLSGVFSAIVEIQVGLSSREFGIGLFQTLDLEDLVDVVGESSPVDHVGSK